MASPRAKAPSVTLWGGGLGDSLQLVLGPARLLLLWDFLGISGPLPLTLVSLGGRVGQTPTHSLHPPTVRTQPGLRAPRLLPLSLLFPISPEIPLCLCQDENLESFPLPSFSHLQTFLP